MDPTLTYRCEKTGASEVISKNHDCFATYHEPQNGFYEHGEGYTEWRAIEDLYRKLERLGYDRTKLPKPNRE